MLWQKNCSESDIYDELWPKERKRFQDPTKTILKSNDESHRIRLMGNNAFGRKKFEQALALYNASLCLAENASVPLALAYANRSLCFFRLKRYANCLKDITLAKRLGPPESVIAKLEFLTQKCNERLMTNKENNVEPSFAANENIPRYMADCFSVEKDLNYGTRVIATKDLEIGQTILIEEPYLHYMGDRSVIRCYNCYKEYMNLIPCRICTKGMFCSETCMETNCVASQCSVCLDESLSETFRSVLLALQAYPNVEELMQATDDIRRRSQLWDEVLAYMSSPSPRTTYRLFFSRGVQNSYLLKEWPAKNIQDQILQYNRIIRNPRIARLFTSLASQRYLQHLILHHVLVMKGCKGAFGLYEEDKLPPKTWLSKHTCYLYARAHYPISNMFNHSCAPNVFLISSDRTLVLKVVQRVKKNQELLVPYFSIGKRLDILEQRQVTLRELGWRLPHQKCICFLCQYGRKPEQNLPDISIRQKLADIIDRPAKNVTIADGINFIHDAIAYLNDNIDEHPSLNTLVAQNGLFIFWHMFPELI